MPITELPSLQEEGSILFLGLGARKSAGSHLESREAQPLPTRARMINTYQVSLHR